MAAPTKQKRGKRLDAKWVARHAEDIARALKLVAQGMSRRDIGRIMGVSHGQAQNLITEGLKGIVDEAAAELRAEVVAREREVIAAHWKKRADPEHARVIQASDKVMLSTLPTKTELTGADGGPIATIDLDPADEILGKLAGIAAGLTKGSGDPGTHSG